MDTLSADDLLARYRKAVETDSLSVDGNLHWGVALQKLSQWDAAIERLTHAVELDPEETFALFYLGSALEQASREHPEAGYFERAVEAFQRLIALRPDDAYALNYLGYSYAERGVHLEEAVELLTRAVGIDPDNGAFFDSLGWAYYRLGKLAEAERQLAQALQQMGDHDDEEQAVIFDHAGDIADALGKRTEAVDHWQRALDLSPQNDELRRKLEAGAQP